jgi:hypothetical protein
VKSNRAYFVILTLRDVVANGWVEDGEENERGQKVDHSERMPDDLATEHFSAFGLDFYLPGLRGIGH